VDSIDQRPTLKQAICDILKSFPQGLTSPDLLVQLQHNGFPKLPRTSMSPQLSRMKDKEVVNVGGRWTLTENKKTAEAKALGGIFE
jgi:hypothetical protein